tara:strand:+ start:1112 stop:1390 length:279 start_codon:yes stop_codon:yes gene_type:complete
MNDEQKPNHKRSGPFGNLFEQLLGDENPVRDQIDRNAKMLAQAALNKLDVVTRAEFDAQTAVLKRIQSRVKALEQALADLTEQLENTQREQP